MHAQVVIMIIYTSVQSGTFFKHFPWIIIEQTEQHIPSLVDPATDSD